MRNRFDFTLQKLLWCCEEMRAQHAAFASTNKIKSVPFALHSWETNVHVVMFHGGSMLKGITLKFMSYPSRQYLRWMTI